MIAICVWCWVIELLFNGPSYLETIELIYYVDSSETLKLVPGGRSVVDITCIFHNAGIG